MKNFFIGIFLSANVSAGMVSQMPSTYVELGIPNSHLVTKNVVRGMAPRNAGDIDKLISLGVSEFLIFKIDTNGDVEKEISLLEKKGIDQNLISHFEFPWKDVTDFRPVCEMTIEALKKLQDAEKNNRRIYFHCSVGEDRTGYLAGLYKIYKENASVKETFDGEMCDKGYEAGNPAKPMNVVAKVRQSLTPAFLSMVEIIKEAKKNKMSLNKKLCVDRDFSEAVVTSSKKLICKGSKLLHK